jgi:hypothetical protein
LRLPSDLFIIILTLDEIAKGNERLPMSQKRPDSGIWHAMDHPAFVSPSFRQRASETNVMNTTATLPDDLELHEGEEFLMRAVAKNGTLIVTRVIRSAPHSLRAKASEKFSFTTKWGSSVAKVTDLEDVILSHINANHVK